MSNFRKQGTRHGTDYAFFARGRAAFFLAGAIAGAVFFARGVAPDDS